MQRLVHLLPKNSPLKLDGFFRISDWTPLSTKSRVGLSGRPHLTNLKFSGGVPGSGAGQLLSTGLVTLGTSSAHY